MFLCISDVLSEDYVEQDWYDTKSFFVSALLTILTSQPAVEKNELYEANKQRPEKAFIDFVIQM